MFRSIITSSIFSLFLVLFTACSDTKDQNNSPVIADQVQQPTEVDIVAKASIANTTSDIQAKLEQQNFNSSINGATAPSASRASTPNQEYSMADVIFTIGSDDLTDASGNTMQKDGAYHWFKKNVADAGKLTEAEAAEFYAATPEQFNEAFVESYYEEAAKIVSADHPDPTALLYGGTSAAGAFGLNRAPKRIFGFFFTMFNPMTYMKMMVNVVKTVMTWALAQMFKMMLLSGTMTKLMLRLSIRFPILTSIMIHVLSQYWGITARMVPYLKYDKEFGELFMQLAYEQPDMAHFVFQNIDAPLYNAMTYSMLLSQETTERMAIMMNWYATAYLVIPSSDNPYDAFTTLLFDTKSSVVQDVDGNLTGHGDGNELANERFYYALFQTPLGTEQFIRAMEKVDENDHATVVAFMDFIFLGTQETDIFPTQMGLNADSMQGTFNIFAIAQGMLSGIEKFGFEAYLQDFIDFAFLIPPERYLDYGQAFGMAGYTYFAQVVYQGDGKPTMFDFLSYLMGAIMGDGTDANPGLLATIEDQDKVAMFQGMLESVQPYIEEFMQNGMPNLQMPNIADSNASVIISGDANETITTPLEQKVKVIPAPTALIGVIDNFPVLWEKNYSNAAYVGDRISNDPFGYSWSEMPETLANLNWMQIPYPNKFQPSSYFDFIFENGTVDMYIIVKENDVTFLPVSQYNLIEVTDMGGVQAYNQFNQSTSFKIFKTTINAGQQLYVYDLIRFTSGIAFDLRGAAPETKLPTGTPPVEPVTTTPVIVSTEPVTEIIIPDTLKPETPIDDTVTTDPVIIPDPDTSLPEPVDPVLPTEPALPITPTIPDTPTEPTTPDTPETPTDPVTPTDPLPPVVAPEPTPTTIFDVIEGLPESWVRNYSDGNYTNNYVTNENSEKWLSMSSFMSSLSWIEIPRYFNLTYNYKMHFNRATTIYFITLNSSKSNFEFIIGQEGNLVSVTESLQSDDSWDTFYVYSLDVPAGYDLAEMDWIKSRTSGLAFDIRQ